MKNLTKLALLAMVACGASSAELKTAREARYKAPPATIYAEAKAAIEVSYKIELADDPGFQLKTEARWYTPEGLVDTSRGNNAARLLENSINFQLFLHVVPADNTTYSIKLEPQVLRQGLGSKPEPVDINDTTLPGWVKGKLEQMQLAIHERLKSFAVRGGGPVVPSAAPAPAAPAPMPPSPDAAPALDPPAGGSAATPAPAQ